jgi:hypothetical protein
MIKISPPIEIRVEAAPGSRGIRKAVAIRVGWQRRDAQSGLSDDVHRDVAQIRPRVHLAAVE